MENSTRKPFSSRRLSKVCARCKKRKTKCDFNFPTCTPCKKAGAICHGYNSVGEAEVPRSLVRSLEDQVAQLESQVEKFRQSPSNLPRMFASKIARATLSVGIAPQVSFFNSPVSSALFLHPSCPPLPVARSKRSARHPPWPSPNRKKIQSTTASSTNLKTIPYVAIEQMVQNYAGIHLPQYPCIRESWLREVLQRVMREKDGDTDAVLNQGISAGSNLGHFEYFVVFILLAISSLTLTWRAESQAMAASDSFFASAMNHLQLMVEVHEIQTLQTSLLLAHYAHMSPEKVDNWICISNAIRIVLDLGLHRQPPKMIDAEKAEMRRQLFWVTYGMERSMCGILRLPLSFPEESITVQVDYSIENPTQDASSTDNCLRKESSANHIYLYRALETEVHRVLHLRETVPFLLNADLTSWFTSINERLTAWHTKARAYSVHQMLEFRDVQYSHLRAKIHRPCPLLRTRTHEDRKICLEACQMLVEDYQRQAQHRRLFYPWHGVHILFEAAVIMLDACWSSRDWTDLRQQARFILSITLPDCLGLLAKVGERWHEAALCGDHLKPVVEEVAKALSERVVGGLEGGMGLDEEMEKREEATTEKLRQLLFPDGPLAWNARTEGTVGGIDEGASLGLDALPPIPGFEDFQWDGNWDLADLLYESVQ